MVEIYSEIRGFYRESIAIRHYNFFPLESSSQQSSPKEESTSKIEERVEPLTRFRFFAGSHFACICLIENVAKSIFFFICNVLTVGLSQNLRDSFYKHARAGLIYFCAIPVGLVGFLFPQAINQEFLEIPKEGSITFFYSNESLIKSRFNQSL